MERVRPAAVPLVAHTDPQQIVAYRRPSPIRSGVRTGGSGPDWVQDCTRAVTVREFLTDVFAVADTLPARSYVLNICSDRYRFSVGLAAAMLRRQTSVLPPSQTREMVRQIAARFPGVYCLTDRAEDENELPKIVYADTERQPEGADVMGAIPAIEVSQVVVCLLTSGTTGAPSFHDKTWGELTRSVAAEWRRITLELSAGRDQDWKVGGSCGNAPVIVGTVPPQHMFGLESTVLLPWQTGAALVADRPLFPADICALLDALPAPRILVTTPFHLRAALAESSNGSGKPLRPELILCATAPLSPELAQAAEERTGSPLLEIYGTTETGQFAMRRSARERRWRTLGDATVVESDGIAWASGGHLGAPVPLSDLLEIHSPHCFALAGRSADMVNIAGKRTSLGFLNVQLNAVAGVVDGVFFMPPMDAAMTDGVTRLIAFVVAPGLARSHLVEALRQRIDAAFLPRPLYFVDLLPRNATGKLTRADLCDLYAAVQSNPTLRALPLSAGSGRPSV